MPRFDRSSAAPPAKRSRAWLWLAVWGLVLATAFVGEQIVRSAWLVGDEPRLVAPRAALSPAEIDTIALFEGASPSVVSIYTGVPGRGGVRRTGTGSGFVWDGAGHIVTNHHVIEGAERVRVRFGDDEFADAVVIGSDPDNDLAVVRLVNRTVTPRPIPIGTSNELKVGQSTFAIGNPFGLSRTLTTGVISALDRRLPTDTGREIIGVIQTDAAINPGNSGGPLLDSAGRLIGVNTAILSETGSFGGIGFAIPVDIVNRIVPALIRDGRVPRPGIGIVIIREEAAARLGVVGLVIGDVRSGSPAAEAGLRGSRPDGTIGDVIVAVNGQTVTNLAAFSRELARIGIGNDATLTVLRDGNRRQVTVRVIDIGV